jgi:hypothetical protein
MNDNDKVVLVADIDESPVSDRVVLYAGGSIGKLRREGFEVVRCVLGESTLDPVTKAAWREVYGVERFPVVPAEAQAVVNVAQEIQARYIITHTYHQQWVARAYGNPVNGIYYCRDKQPNCLVNILDALDMKLRFIDLCAPNLSWLGERYTFFYSRQYIQMLLPRIERVDYRDRECMAQIGAEALKLWVIGLATHQYDCPCWTPSEAFRLNLGIDLAPMQTSLDFVYPGIALQDHWKQQQGSIA